MKLCPETDLHLLLFAAELLQPDVDQAPVPAFMVQRTGNPIILMMLSVIGKGIPPQEPFFFFLPLTVLKTCIFSPRSWFSLLEG